MRTIKKIKRHQLWRLRNSEQWFRFGMNHFESGSTRKAIKCWKIALEFNSRCPATHCALGVAYFDLTRLNASMYHSIKAIDNDCPNATPFIYLSLAFLDREYFEEVVTILQNALSAFPEESGLHYMLFRSYSKMSDSKKAGYHIEQALKLDDSVFAYWADYAKLSLERKDYCKALTCANRIIQQNPSLPEGHFYKGVASYNLDDLLAATNAFSAALRLDPGNKLIKNSLDTCNGSQMLNLAASTPLRVQ